MRNVLRSWFPRGTLPQLRGEEMSFDDLVWNVCRMASPAGEILGWTELPPPGIAPRPAREFLRALTVVALGLGARQVNFRALDGAYSQVYNGNMGRKTKCAERKIGEMRGNDLVSVS